MSDHRTAVVLAAVLLAPSAANAEPGVTLLSLPFAVEQFRGPGTYFARAAPSSAQVSARKIPVGQPVIAVWGKEGGALLTLDKGQLTATPWASPPGEEPPIREAPGDAIPHARQQSAGPLTVYLSQPRTEYRHGVLGDAVEAGQVTILERQRLDGVSAEPRPVPTRLAAVAAGPDAVFEDLEPRLADIDGDGTPEVLVVRSTLDKGAALSVIAKREGGWRILAETPPAGQPNRWINPAGVADLDGDGRADLVIVRAPHIEGALQHWTWDGAKLVLKGEIAGYSNHALGSTALDLAAVTDASGRPELAIPTLDRRALAFVSFRGGLKETARVALPARAERGLAVLGSGRDARVVVALEDGRVAVVTR